MKLKMKCDGCGKNGSADEISTDHNGRDLCAVCAQAAKLADLKERYAAKKAWLESTHLKELRELEKQIADMESLASTGVLEVPDWGCNIPYSVQRIEPHP